MTDCICSKPSPDGGHWGDCPQRPVAELKEARERIRRMQSDMVSIAARLARDSWDDSPGYLAEKMKLAAGKLRDSARGD